MMNQGDEAVRASDGAVGVERYAEVLAHTVYFAVAFRQEILVRLGVDPAAWAAADLLWTQALAHEALQDDRPRTAAFAAAFAPVLKRLKLEKPRSRPLDRCPKRRLLRIGRRASSRERRARIHRK
jgi:hypothetical protein